MTNETTTDIAALPPADRAMIVLNATKTEADIKAMVAEAQTITEVTDKNGREVAHRMAMKLRTARTTITKTGKTARDDATAFCKAVIDEEKRLVGLMDAEEERMFALREAFDKRIEEEKAAKAAKLAEIQSKIDGIRGLPLAVAGCTSDEIAAERDALDAFEPVEEVFGELLVECIDAKRECILALCDLYNRVLAQEVAAAAVKAEAERIAQAERDAAAKLAEERAAFEAERAAYEAEKRAFEERKAAEAAASSVEQSGSVSAPLEEQAAAAHEKLDRWLAEEPADVMPVVEVTAEEAAQVFTEAEPVQVTDFRIRRLALATADQFDALSAKVAIVGFIDFAQQLEAVSHALRNGSHDRALASSDLEAIVASDNALIDATMNAIDALADQAAAA